jgi:hypothetical protein
MIKTTTSGNTIPIFYNIGIFMSLGLLGEIFQHLLKLPRPASVSLLFPLWFGSIVIPHRVKHIWLNLHLDAMSEQMQKGGNC